MARKQATTNGKPTDSIWETGIVTPTISTSNGNLTAAGLFTGTFTAPNTSGKTTGCRIFVATKPANGGNIVITLQEATVDTACTTSILNADIKIGWNYVRFPTPYQWTSTAAGRYRFKVANSVGTSGSVALIAAASTVSFMDTYDTLSTVGSSDDMNVDGLNAAGLTTVLITGDGTTFTHGSGTDKAVNNNAPRSVGEGISIGNGGTFKLDNTATTTFQTRGQIVAYEGGTYDKRGHATDHTIVSTHIIDCETANGNYAINNISGGRILTKGAPCTRYAEYVSGVGTAANPLIVDRACDWQVGEEIAISGDTYLKVESRFIKTRNSSTSFVLCTTPGGAEAAFTNTHNATETVALLSRNSVIKPQNIARGTYLVNNNTNAGEVDVTDTQFYYPSVASGIGGIQLINASGKATMDGVVLYGGVSNRNGIAVTASTDTETITGLFSYLGTSTNAGSGSLTLGAVGTSGIANKTFVDFIVMGSQSQSLIITNGANCTVSNFRGNGNNTTNAAAGHAMRLIGCNGITINSSRFNSTRSQALQLDGTSGVVFNNCAFASMGTNTVDIQPQPSTANDVLFNNCTFGSATLISGYLSQLEGSIIRFHKYQATNNRHRWYTINGSAFSSGAGLDKTTVATVGSLAVALLPETLTGLKAEHPIPVNVGEVISVYGKFWCNAAFLADGSSSLVAELFLPGSLTADQTVTLTKTTDPTSNNAVFRLGLTNTSLVKDIATVRLTAKSAVAGAEAYIDDFNGGTNAISAYDIWYQGQPVAFQLTPQTLGDSAANAAATWNYTDSNPVPATMGKRQIDGSKAKLLL